MTRTILLLLCALLPAACSTFSPTATGPITTRTAHAADAAAAISAYRRSRGLPPVRVDYTLMRAAEEQARAIAAADALSHDVAGSFGRRMSAHGVRGAAAENLSAGAPTPSRVLERWKASPGHNENLLLPGATRIGLVEAEAPNTRYKRFWVLLLADG